MRNFKTIDWGKLINEHHDLLAFPSVLRQKTRIRSFKAQQVLYKIHQLPEAMLYVLSGELKLVRHTSDGKEIVLQRSRHGFVAEASFDTSTYHCDIIAATNSRLLLFPIQTFKKALLNHPEFNYAWIRILASEIRRLRAYSERLNLNHAADRIVHYIESEGNEGSIILEQTRKAWAYELGLSHEVVYRSLKQLKDTGRLSITGQKFTLNQDEI